MPQPGRHVTAGQSGGPELRLTSGDRDEEAQKREQPISIA